MIFAPRQKLKKQAGFTLIEVLVALLIFSTAIMGLMHAGTENIRAVSILEQKQLAGIVADNQLLLALNNSDQSIKPGMQQDSVDMGGRHWLWKIRTEDTGTSGFYRLTITVKQKNSEQVLVSRTAFATRKQGQNPRQQQRLQQQGGRP